MTMSATTVRRGLSAVHRIRGLSETRLLGIVGNAGSGKSHLGAQLTAPSDARPGGVFIRAIGLREGATLDDLATRIPDLGVDTFDALLGGLDAAGARDGARLPIVIDGLNESQRPADWHEHTKESQMVPGRRNHRRAPSPEIKKVSEQPDESKQHERHVRAQHPDGHRQQRNREDPPRCREVP